MSTREHVEDPHLEEHIKEKGDELKDVKYAGKVGDSIKTDDPVTTEASAVEEKSSSMTTKEESKETKNDKVITEEVNDEKRKKTEAEPREIAMVDDKGEQADQIEMKKDEVEKADASNNTKVDNIPKQKLEEAQKNTDVVEEAEKEEGKKTEAKARDIIVENEKKEDDITEKKMDEVEKTDASNYIKDDKSSSIATKEKLEDALKEGVVKEEKKKTGAEQLGTMADDIGKQDYQMEKKINEVENVDVSDSTKGEKSSLIAVEAEPTGIVVENKGKQVDNIENKKNNVEEADASKYTKVGKDSSTTTKEMQQEVQKDKGVVEGVVKDQMKKIEEKPKEVVVENKEKEVDQTENKKDEVKNVDASKDIKIEKSSLMGTKEKLEEVHKEKGVVEGMVKDMKKKIEEKPREDVVENTRKEVDQTKNKKDEVEKADASKFIEVKNSSSMPTKEKLEQAQKDKSVVEEVVKDTKKKIEEKPRENVVGNRREEVDQTDNKKDEVEKDDASKCIKLDKSSPMGTNEKMEELPKDKGLVAGMVKDMKKKIEEENVVKNKGKEVNQTENKKDEVKNVDASKGIKIEKSSLMGTKEKMEEVQKDKGVVERMVNDMKKKIEEKPIENVVQNKGKELVDKTEKKKDEVENVDASKCTKVENNSSMKTEEKLEEASKDEEGIVEDVVHKDETNKSEAKPMDIEVDNKLRGETTYEEGLKDDKVNDQAGNGNASESGRVEKCSSLREERNSLLELKEDEKKALIELRSKIEKAIHENQLLKGNKEQATKEKEISHEVDDAETKQKDEENETKAESDDNNKDAPKVHSNISEDIAIWGVPLLPSKEDNATDVILLKFLKAKDFEVNDAFEMLRNTLKWRKDNNIDSILDENFDKDLSSVSIMDGVSREGHPVYYSSFKLFGNDELYNKVLGTEEKRNMFIRSRIQLMERAIQKLDFNSGGVSSIFLVNDCKDMPGPSRKELRNALKQILTLHQDNYPEFVARHIFINVPFWYYAFSASTFLSPFLTPKSNSKFIFARPAKVNDVLVQYIALEELPVHYGGFRKENDSDFSTDDVHSEISLNQSSTEIIRIPIQAGVSLLWEVLVSGWEVNYKEEFIPTDDRSYSVIIQRRKKISGQEGPIRNSFTCKEPGNIVITIENGALIKKKRICYRYKMMKIGVPLEKSN